MIQCIHGARAPELVDQYLKMDFVLGQVFGPIFLVNCELEFLAERLYSPAFLCRIKKYAMKRGDSVMPNKVDHVLEIGQLLLCSLQRIR